MRGFTWTLAVAALCFDLGMLVGCDARGHSTPVQAKPATEPQPQPLFTPVAATLAQQKMCDEQAAKRFNEDKDSDDLGTKKKNPPITTYTSHYDPAVNVCYVRIHSVYANPAMVSDIVYDAFGGRIFAAYSWVNSQGKKFWEVAPSQCEITIPGKPAEECKVDTQFDELVDKYFGVTQ